MSNALLTAAWAVDLLSTYERIVLVRLADRANDKTGGCWPSVASLARDCSCGVRTVQGVLKELEKRGLISVERNAGPKGCNVYRLTLPPATDAPPHVVHPSTADSQPPQVTTASSAGGAPEPKKNPKKTLPKKAAKEMEMEVEAIKAGKRYLLSGVSAHKARELVSEGRVTEAQCQAVGLL
ncbi:helix-turn-helix domain-containing protein [Phycobacter azelaicus]|uniref:helix-turn-helix domain-containing protein n=1 Tax=Phycobacter azelaicus TaxID=2668075 RepID=UPI001867A025|nr:helix-turn-helix domain-containing protein [Phycobacter azelaicus]